VRGMSRIGLDEGQAYRRHHRGIWGHHQDRIVAGPCVSGVDCRREKTLCVWLMKLKGEEKGREN
jgi:hypothetical protein